KLFRLSHDLNTTIFNFGKMTCLILFWSLCNHLCRVGMVICLAASLGLNLSVTDALIVVPASLLISMAPISIGGWGVREVVLVHGLSLVGIASGGALAISVLYGAIWLINALVGFFAWIAERKLVANARLQFANAAEARRL